MVSPAIDAAICGEDFQLTGKPSGHVIMTLAAISDEADPPGLTAYDGGSFALAPPAPMTPTAAEPGQFCRFANGDEWLAVAPFDPQGQDIETWWRPKMEAYMKKDHCTPFGTGYTFPVVGCLSGGWWDETTDIHHFYFIHQGKGFDVSCNNAGQMNYLKEQKLLEGWRWPAEKKTP